MRRMLFAIVIGLGGAAILISLGVWQVQRLAWKEALLERIAAEIGSAPQPLKTGLPRYTPVEVAGRFAEGHLRMLASRKTIGPVYRIIRPFEAEGIGRILVDTGWQRDGKGVIAAAPQTVELVGNVDTPNEADSYTPEPDLAKNIWFARDVPAMAEALNTKAVLIVLRERPQVDLGVTPWPVDTVGIPNDHLQYAITWFSLATIWLAMSVYFLQPKKG